MVNMNIMTEEMKKELAFTEEELKELEQFYQFPKPFYQLSKFLNFDTKIRGKKLLPTKSLVNSNANIAQTSINPGYLTAKSSQNRWGLCNIVSLNLTVRMEGLQRNLRLFFMGVGI